MGQEDEEWKGRKRKEIEKERIGKEGNGGMGKETEEWKGRKRKG